jgi:hypothetical protein
MFLLIQITLIISNYISIKQAITALLQKATTTEIRIPVKEIFKDNKKAEIFHVQDPNKPVFRNSISIFAKQNQ